MSFSAIRLQSARLIGLLSAGWMLTVLSGCSCTKGGCHWFDDPGPPPVKDVLVWWDDHIHLTPDPARGGVSLPGLAGRAYLFSSDDNKQLAEASGKIMIEMYDMTAAQTGGEPSKLVAVTYDMNALKQLKNKDQVGDGYTLFIPWETYNPAVKEVKLHFAYVPEKGTPHHTDPIWVTLKTATPPAPSIQGQTQQIVPAFQTIDRK